MNNIAILGLGYVGLPLAIEFSKKFHNVVGFDIDEILISDLKLGNDSKKIFGENSFKRNEKLTFTSNPVDISNCNYFIVTVPTPVDEFNTPNLNPIKSASELIGKRLKFGDIVIYESTVYPGCTEEFCVPILEANSGLKHNIDFYTGYSPERINPGDRERELKDIVKITSGSTPEAASLVDKLYKEIILAGTYKVSSIKVAEASKVIENTQRDVNIALINELASIFGILGINTNEVLDAAATKWNFHKYTPGLVGGHCIGVDPYYLIHKAQEVGYEPKFLISARMVNDSFAINIAKEIIKKMILKGLNIKESKIGVLGITFKEDCSDIRNSKVLSLINYLIEWGANISVSDPHALKLEVKDKHNIDIKDLDEISEVDVLIVAVAHKEYKNLNLNNIKKRFKSENNLLVDIKSIINKNDCQKKQIDIYQI